MVRLVRQVRKFQGPPGAAAPHSARRWARASRKTRTRRQKTGGCRRGRRLQHTQGGSTHVVAVWAFLAPWAGQPLFTVEAEDGQISRRVASGSHLSCVSKRAHTPVVPARWRRGGGGSGCAAACSAVRACTCEGCAGAPTLPCPVQTGPPRAPAVHTQCTDSLLRAQPPPRKKAITQMHTIHQCNYFGYVRGEICNQDAGALPQDAQDLPPRVISRRGTLMLPPGYV